MANLYQCRGCGITLYGDYLESGETYNYVVGWELCSSCQAEEDNYDDDDDDDDDD